MALNFLNVNGKKTEVMFFGGSSGPSPVFLVFFWPSLLNPPLQILGLNPTLISN